MSCGLLDVSQSRHTMSRHAGVLRFLEKCLGDYVTQWYRIMHDIAWKQTNNFPFTLWQFVTCCGMHGVPFVCQDVLWQVCVKSISGNIPHSKWTWWTHLYEPDINIQKNTKPNGKQCICQKNYTLPSRAWYHVAISVRRMPRSWPPNKPNCIQSLLLQRGLNTLPCYPLIVMVFITRCATLLMIHGVGSRFCPKTHGVWKRQELISWVQ
jgi:predicted membrane protein